MAANVEKMKSLFINDIIISNKFTFEMSKQCVRSSNSNHTEYKALTLDIMKEVESGHDAYTMAAVANVVGKWACEQVEYYKEVIKFCREHHDISEALLGDNCEKKDIILLVDDSTKEEVLDYNDFMFEVRENYSEVDDFIIIDNFMKSAIEAMYHNLECIYVRG